MKSSTHMSNGKSFSHKLTVTYDGQIHEVDSFEAAWNLAWAHIPATIHDPSA